jgi:hypothetical protein
MECYYLRIYDRWLFGATEYVTSHSETLVLVTILFVVPTTYRIHVIGGPRTALGSAIMCGILLGVFEGVGVLFNRVTSAGQRPQMAPRK